MDGGGGGDGSGGASSSNEPLRVTDDVEAEEPTPEQLAFLLESEAYTV